MCPCPEITFYNDDSFRIIAWIIWDGMQRKTRRYQNYLHAIDKIAGICIKDENIEGWMVLPEPSITRPLSPLPRGCIYLRLRHSVSDALCRLCSCLSVFCVCPDVSQFQRNLPKTKMTSFSTSSQPVVPNSMHVVLFHQNALRSLLSITDKQLHPFFGATVI